MHKAPAVSREIGDSHLFSLSPGESAGILPAKKGDCHQFLVTCDVSGMQQRPSRPEKQKQQLVM
jgi:hypothetical protein